MRDIESLLETYLKTHKIGKKEKELVEEEKTITKEKE